MRKITTLLILVMLNIVFPMAAYAADTKSPTAPSGLQTLVPATSNRVELTWTASYDAVGVAGYDIYRNSGKIATTTGTTFVDDLVSPLRSYQYYIVAFDAAGNRSVASNILTVTTPAPPDPLPPTAPSNLQTSSLTTTSVTLTWSASTDNVGVSGYEIYKNGAKLTTTKLLRVTDPSLAAGTTYSYYVIATDAAGNKSPQSNTVTVTTLGGQDTIPPSAPTGLFSSVDLNTQPPMVDLFWEPATDNVGVMGYRIYRSTDGGATFNSIGTTTFTNYTDSDIQQGNYTYYVAAYDAANNLSQPSNSVTESISGDTEPPSAPTGLATSAVAASQVDLFWNPATDNVGVSWYEVYRSEDGVDYSMIGMSFENAYADLTVLAGSSYYYYLIAVDEAINCSAESNIIIVTTPSELDTQAPTTPIGLQATVVSANLVNLSWLPATDNVSVTGYKIYRDGNLVGTTVGTDYADSSVSGPMTYLYTVSAVDAVGNQSAPSASVKVSTPTPPDTTPPTAPSNLLAVVTADSQVNLTWNASEDNLGVTGYEIYRDNTLLTTVTTLNYTDSNVATGMLYTYAVIALDAAGNKSLPSNNAVVNVTDLQPPTIPSNVVATALSSTQVELSWVASTDNIGVASYDVYRNNLKIAAVTGTNYSDTTVLPLTAYNYYVIATDAAGNKSPQSNTVTVTTLDDQDTTPPSAPTGLFSSVNLIQPPLLELSWDSATDNVEVTGYRIYRSIDDGATFSSIATSEFTNYTDADIQPGTNYTYYVVAYDGANNLSQPSNYVTESISEDTEPPSAPTGLATSAVTATQVDLTWNPATDNVGVGWYELYQSEDGVDYSLIGISFENAYTDSTVLAGSQYYYYVIAVDEVINCSAESNIIIVTTPSELDTEAPTAPKELQATVVSPNLVNLSWSPATDNVSVTGYRIYRDGNLVGTTAGTDYADSSVSGPMTYLYTVSAVDAAGNQSAPSASVSVSTPTPADTTAPTAPGNLVAVVAAASQVNLTWSASEDNLGVTGYEIYRDNALLTSVTTLDYTDSNVAAGVLYSYYVIAIDAAGNQSQPSNTAVVNIPDTQSPTTPSNLTATALSSTKVELAWTASTDNISVASYDVYRNNLKIATVTATNYSDSAVLPAITYSYNVVALDAVGNQSATSAAVVVTTPGDTQAPSAPSNLSASVANGQINLTWTVSTDNVGVTGYEVSRDNTIIATTTGTTYTDTTAANGTTIAYFVKALDGATNKSAASNTAYATLPDTEPPTAPANLTGTALQSNQVQLTWGSSIDNVGVSGYEVYRNSIKLGTASTTTYTDNGTVANGFYRYYVVSYDAAGNKSVASNSIVIVPPDTLAPTTPSLQAKVVSATQVDLNWSSSTDNVGVAGYEVYRNNLKLATTAYPSFSDTNTAPSTVYTYYVLACDAAGNQSNASNIVTVTTPVNLDTKPPVVPSEINVQVVSATEISLTWTVSTDNVAVAGYLLYRDDTQIADVTTNQYADTGLNEGTMYSYYVKAYDQAGNISGPSYTIYGITPTIDSTPPDAPANLQTTAVYYNRVDLIWTASTDNVGVTGYDIYRNEVLVGTVVKTSFVDTTISPSTNYSYYVVARDLAGNTSSSNTVTVSTPTITDTIAPTTPANLSQLAVNYNSIALTWQGSTDNVGVVGYELIRSNFQEGESILSTTQTTYTDTNVMPASQYTYKVRAFDAAGNKSGESNTITVTTLNIPDTLPPQSPTMLVAKAVSNSQINLSWAAAGDNVGVTGYEVYRDGLKITTTSQLAYSDVGLTTGVTYTYYLVALDGAGNKSLPSASASATPSSDTLAPSAPTGLNAIKYTSTYVDLAWNPASDNIGVTGYKVYRNGIVIATADKNSYTDPAVVPGYRYTYYVMAFDASGNLSIPSSSISVVIPLGVDIIPPSTPTSLRVVNAMYNQVDLFWNASTDNVGIKGYMVYRNNVYVGTALLNKYSDKTVTTKTTYTYYIVAFDAAGNKSTASNQVTVTTPVGGDSIPPTVPSDLTAIATAYNRVELSWTAATDNLGVAGYLVYRNNVFVATVASAAYIDTKVLPSTVYSYYVIAFDASKNKSGASTTVTVTTPAIGT